MADLSSPAWPATVNETYNWQIQINPTNPPNLTGYTGDMQVRSTAGSTIILEATTSNTNPASQGVMTLGGTLGTVNVTIPAVLITTPGNYLYELKLVDPSGVISKPLGGQFVIQSSVTP